MTLTLSMGIGTGSAEYSKNYDVAKAAMDLALGRGGDQALLKMARRHFTMAEEPADGKKYKSKGACKSTCIKTDS